MIQGAIQCSPLMLAMVLFLSSFSSLSSSSAMFQFSPSFYQVFIHWVDVQLAILMGG